MNNSRGYLLQVSAAEMLLELGWKSGDPEIIIGLAKLDITGTDAHADTIVDDLSSAETLLAEVASRKQGRVRTDDLHGFNLHAWCCDCRYK